MLTVVAPAAFSLFVAFPDLASTKSLAAVAFVGLPPLLAQKARNMGKRLEPSLWARWGGKPTVRLLRHRDSVVAELTKARYFNYLLHEIGLERPTPQQEAEDPASADAVYQSAADWLMRLSRDPKIGALVASKNAAYGFARNLLGVRWVGFLIAAFSAAAMAALACHRWPADGSGPGPEAAAAGVGLFAAALWIGAVNPDSVRSADDAYAKALLECADVGGRGLGAAITHNPINGGPKAAPAPAAARRKTKDTTTSATGDDA